MKMTIETSSRVLEDVVVTVTKENAIEATRYLEDHGYSCREITRKEVRGVDCLVVKGVREVDI